MQLRSRKKQSGIGLIMAVGLITLVAFLSVAILRSVDVTARGGGQASTSYRAFLAAEAGAELNINAVVSPTAGTPHCTDITYDLDQIGLRFCSANVECRETAIDGELVYTIESTGVCQPGDYSSSRTVLVRLSG